MEKFIGKFGSLQSLGGVGHVVPPGGATSSTQEYHRKNLINPRYQLHKPKSPRLGFYSSTPSLKDQRSRGLQDTTMAFFNRASSILRQAAASKHINPQMSAATPSIFQMIRCMSSSKVFVGGLAWATDDQSLKEAFSPYGEVHEARVIMDRETGRSRGFGFVTFGDTEAASAAVQAMDQRELHGRMVRVNYANDRPQGGGGYGGGGGGGYGGSGGGYGGNSYGSGGDGGYGGGSVGGGFGGESQQAAGGGDAYGSGGPVEGGYGNNDEPDDFAKRA
ncbi:unnamed protein product [Lactuca saligna]|uniref:RRM domain-containing protein n=1 Tax=Lactuca saligna TaxID=75948 RepID=A0AA36E496_LACSI|nr:unnamed protein product [Lactuca saligna]